MQTDHVILADIYAARETDTLGISSKDLAQALKEKGLTLIISLLLKRLKTSAKRMSKRGLLITMETGDVVNIGETLLK